MQMDKKNNIYSTKQSIINGYNNEQLVVEIYKNSAIVYSCKSFRRREYDIKNNALIFDHFDQHFCTGFF